MNDYSPIISKKIAEDINQKLQSQIDSRLFFFCNYTPTPICIKSPNPEAWFLVSVQNLYKFAIDTTFAFKKFLCDGDYKVKNAIGDIEVLRSVIDHNQNEHNGFYESVYLKNYKKLIYEKDERGAEKQKSFEALNESLKNIAKILVDATTMFIDQKSKATAFDKGIFVEEWIDATIEWYNKPTKTAIYRGILFENPNYTEHEEDYRAYLIASKCMDLFVRKDKNGKDVSVKDMIQLIKNSFEKYPKQSDALIKQLKNWYKNNDNGEVKAIEESLTEEEKKLGSFSKVFYKNAWESSVRETIETHTGNDDPTNPFTLLPQSLFKRNVVLFDEMIEAAIILGEYNNEWTDLR